MCANAKPDELLSQIPFIQQALLDWFAANGRDLPWRRTRDPYHILVSEVMLQQIQVTRAIPFYLTLIERFPRVRSLAEAPIAEVIRVWGDMGRYRRIGYLHRAAREIVDRFGGVVPSTVEELRSLPGIGPYAAGAIACFAFEQDVGFVDTNVRRVIGRIFGGADSLSEKEIGDLAARLVPIGRSWDWNQGLLDFGAMQCTARAPKCESCPLQVVCAAHPVANAAKATSAGKRRPMSLNRAYRGRVLAALRERDDGEAVALEALGQSVKPGFEPADLPWLYDVVSSLASDGLAMLSEDRPAYDVDGGDPSLLSVEVRLP
jgi:A/G-specific adenine glycosylase